MTNDYFPSMDSLASRSILTFRVLRVLRGKDIINAWLSNSRAKKTAPRGKSEVVDK